MSDSTGTIVRRAAHPAAPAERLAGGPQMVEVSRAGRGRRVHQVRLQGGDVSSDSCRYR
jgi:hypothetical protein